MAAAGPAVTAGRAPQSGNWLVLADCRLAPGGHLRGEGHRLVVRVGVAGAVRVPGQLGDLEERELAEAERVAVLARAALEQPVAAGEYRGGACLEVDLRGHVA